MGKSALSNDRFVRTVGWHRTVAEEMSILTTEERQLLEAYAEGVNAYVSANQGRLGLEFFILGLTGVSYEPEPWEPMNTMTWPKMMALTLGGNMDTELIRAHIAARLGTPAVSTLMPPYREGAPFIVPSPLTDATLQAVPDAIYDLQFFGSGDGIGSNNWVTSTDRTDTGGAILANDPHLGIQMPSIWYEIGLHCDPVSPECPFNLVGISAALGELIGALTIYMTGHGAGRAINSSKHGKIQAAYERLLNLMERRGPLTLFVVASVVNPFFYPAALAAGALRFGLKKYIFIVLAGKLIKCMTVVYAGYFGLKGLFRAIGIEL